MMLMRLIKASRHDIAPHWLLLLVADYTVVIRSFDAARVLYSPLDESSVKEIDYNMAKEQTGDMQGALDDFTYVRDKFGPFSTAVEGIDRL